MKFKVGDKVKHVKTGGIHKTIMSKLRIELFQRPQNPKMAGQPRLHWYFRIVARNGRRVAQSEGYLRYAACLQTVRRLVDPATEFDILILGKDDK